MGQVSIPQAAAILGVSIDTVRRRIHAQALTAEKDHRGRWLVTLEAAGGLPTPPSLPEGSVTSRDLEHANALIAELHAQRAALLQELADARRERQAAADERAELRILLGKALEQLQTPWWARNRGAAKSESKRPSGRDSQLHMLGSAFDELEHQQPR